MSISPPIIIPSENPPDTKIIQFQPMGFCLEIITNSSAILDAAHISFSRFGQVGDGVEPDFHFRLFTTNIENEFLEAPNFEMNGAQLYKTVGTAGTLQADTNEGWAYGEFSPNIATNTAYFRWHFLELAFFLMLEAKGWMGVHAAALAKNDKAILIRAKSGGGKTTLAYAGARQRFQALAEDVVWLDSSEQRWWGTPWSFHLLPDATTLFPELVGYQPVLQTNNELKLEVNLESIHPGSTTFSATPTAILLVERNKYGESRIEKISSQTLQARWPEACTGLEMKLPHHAQHMKTLFSHPCYRLHFGDNIEQALDLLEPLFE